MSLRNTNLNLLPVLQALLKEGSITRAATTLGLSQPAASQALGRLRELLGDPLLVQTGRTMRLTTRAEQLRPAIDGVCGAIEALLLDAAFVPAQARRDFVVATPDYMALLLAPSVMRQLVESAPGISVRFTDIGPDFRQQLASGHVDIAIIAEIEDAVRGFQVQGGYIDRFVCVVATNHPLARRPPQTIDELRAYPRLGVDAIPAGLRAPSHIAELVASSNGPLRMSVSHLLVLPLIVSQTRGVAIIPETLARQAAQMVDICQFELPGPAVPLDLCLIWSPALESDLAHRWLRAELDVALQVHFRRAANL